MKRHTSCSHILASLVQKGGKTSYSQKRVVPCKILFKEFNFYTFLPFSYKNKITQVLTKIQTIKGVPQKKFSSPSLCLYAMMIFRGIHSSDPLLYGIILNFLSICFSVVMAGIIAIYGVVVSVLIAGELDEPPKYTLYK